MEKFIHKHFLNTVKCISILIISIFIEINTLTEKSFFCSQSSAKPGSSEFKNAWKEKLLTINLLLWSVRAYKVNDTSISKSVNKNSKCAIDV